MQATWDETLGIMAGSQPIYIWTRMKYAQNGTGMDVETRLCGLQMQTMTTTAVAGGLKVSQEVPAATFDVPSMPTVRGTAARADGMIQLNPIALAVGLMDANAQWPTAATAVNASQLSDPDADGKPGITVIPKSGAGYTLPPINILLADHADALYSIVRFQFSTAVEDVADTCPDTLEGTADVPNVNILIVGCHLESGAMCTADDADFINQNRPMARRDKGTLAGKVIPADATCEQIRTMLPVPMQ